MFVCGFPSLPPQLLVTGPQKSEDALAALAAGEKALEEKVRDDDNSRNMQYITQYIIINAVYNI